MDVFYNVNIHLIDITKIVITIFNILARLQQIIVNRLRYPIFVIKHEKDAKYIYILKNMMGETLKFGRMHETTFFYVFF